MFLISSLTHMIYKSENQIEAHKPQKTLKKSILKHQEQLNKPRREQKYQYVTECDTKRVRRIDTRISKHAEKLKRILFGKVTTAQIRKHTEKIKEH